MLLNFYVPQFVNKYQNVDVVFYAIDEIVLLKKDYFKNPDLLKQKIYCKDNFEWQPIYENNGKDFVSAILSYKHKKIRIPWLQVKKSNIPGAGLGLFALQDFPAHSCIGAYIGHTVKTIPENSIYGIQNGRVKMDCKAFPENMDGMGVHMGNDHDFLIQERICQYKMYLKRRKELDLEIKNERVKTKEITDLLNSLKELNKKYIDSLKSNGSTVDAEKSLKHESCGMNNANIRTDFGCVTTKEILSGEEITYEYNWVESSE